MENNIDLNETYESNKFESVVCPFCKKEQPKTAKCSCGYYFDKKLYELEVESRTVESYSQNKSIGNKESNKANKNTNELESAPNKEKWLPGLIIGVIAALIYGFVFVKKGSSSSLHSFIAIMIAVTVSNIYKWISK